MRFFKRTGIGCFIFIFVLLCVFCLGVAAEGEVTSLRILTEQSGENNFLAPDGELRGYSTDIVREIMKRLGKEYPIEILPWKRGYQLALSVPNVVLFSTTRTAFREDLFKWAGPLYMGKFAFYSRKGRGFSFSMIDDAKKVGSIGCYRDDVREQMLRKRGFTNLDGTYGSDANVTNIKKLLRGRIDLWITSYQVMASTAGKLGIDPGELEEVFVVSTYYAYIAFSNQTPDRIVDEWQGALREIKEDGTYEKIMLKYATGKGGITYEPRATAKELKVQR